MSLEKAIEALTAAVEANTKAILGGAAPAKATKSTKAVETVAETPAAAAPAASAATGIDYEATVKPAILAFAKTHGRDKLDNLFASEFAPAKGGKDLKPEQYELFMKRLKEVADEGDLA